MSDTKIDILSPAFIAGFLGMAITGTAIGFLIAALAMWVALFLILFAAAAFSPATRGSEPVSASRRKMTSG